MNHHAFGGVSSSSCSNYTLKKNTVDNEPKFGNEAAKILKKTFR